MSERRLTLDEIEEALAKLVSPDFAEHLWWARSIVFEEHCATPDDRPFRALLAIDRCQVLKHHARALLALLPVVRAAEAWREHGPGQSHCEEEDCPCTSTVCRLKLALAAMRSQLAKEQP